MITFRFFALALLAAGDPVVSAASSTLQLKWSDPSFQSLTEKEQGRLVMDSLNADSQFLRKVPTNRDQERSLNINNVIVFPDSTSFEGAAPSSLLPKQQAFMGSGPLPESCVDDPLDKDGSRACGAIVPGLSISSNGGGGLVRVGAVSIGKDSITKGFISLAFDPPTDAVSINFSPLLQDILGPVTVTLKDADDVELHSFDHTLTAGSNFLGFVKPPSSGDPLVPFASFASIQLGVAGQVPIDLTSVAFGDPDMDDDGVHDNTDNCVNNFNPVQANEDEDTAGDACDECPTNNQFVMDTLPPDAVCEPASVTLAGDSVSITPSDVGNMSSDDCGAGISLVIDKETFGCDNVEAVGGSQTVVLTVTDAKGLTATCTADVNVVDNEAPSVGCQDITVELDASGAGSVAVDGIKNGVSDNCGIASELLDGFGQEELSAVSADCSHVMGTNSVTLTVSDPSGNDASCLATVTVEDKISPMCKAKAVSVDVTAGGEPGTVDAALIDNESTDNCMDGLSLTLSQTSFGCGTDGDGLGDKTVTLTVKDASDNEATCGATVTVKDPHPPSVTCTPVTVLLDANGDGMVLKSAVGDATDEGCGVAGTNGGEVVTFACTNIGDANTVTFMAEDYGENTATCDATVTVEDKRPPVPVCETDTVVVPLDANGDGTVTAANIDKGSTDNCGTVNFEAVTPSSFDCGDAGMTMTSTLTMNDSNGNTNSCEATIKIMDMMNPTPMCKNHQVDLDAASGMATIVTGDIDNGSSDNCAIAGISLDTSTFGCTDVGTNTVTMTVEDVNGNSETCIADVTIEDVTKPNAQCNADITLTLSDDGGGGGTASLAVNGVDNASSDACEISIVEPMTISKNSFDCSNTATPVTVTLTVTDKNGNVNTCDSEVTTEDVTAPQVVCKDTTLPIDAGCQTRVITIDDIRESEDDNCGVTSRSLDDSSPPAIGDLTKSVTLTVTDPAGLTGTCTSTITVNNKDPVATCLDTDLLTDKVAITEADIDAGSNDDEDTGCVPMLSLDKTDGFVVCDPTPVTLTVTDPYGASASCTSTVISAPTGTLRTVTIADFPSGTEIRIQGVTSNPNFQLADGFTVQLEAGTTYNYKIKVNNKATPGWLTYTVPVLNCSPELSVANDFTTVNVIAPTGVEVQIQSTGSPPPKLANEDTLALPKNLNIRYRVIAGGVNGPWVPASPGENIGDAATYELNVSGAVSTVTVKIAAGPDLDGAMVRYPQSNTGTLYANGDTFLLPKDKLVKYRVVVNGKASAAIDYTPTAMEDDLDTVADFGSFVFTNIPTVNGDDDSPPEIQFQSVGKAIDAADATIWLPVGFTAKWRPAVNGYVEPAKWNDVIASRTVTVAAAEVSIDGDGLFCTATIMCTTTANLSNIKSCESAEANLLPLNTTPNRIGTGGTVVLITGKAIRYRIGDSDGSSDRGTYDYTPGEFDMCPGGGALLISQ